MRAVVLGGVGPAACVPGLPFDRAGNDLRMAGAPCAARTNGSVTYVRAELEHSHARSCRRPEHGRDRRGDRNPPCRF